MFCQRDFLLQHVEKLERQGFFTACVAEVFSHERYKEVLRAEALAALFFSTKPQAAILAPLENQRLHLEKPDSIQKQLEE